MFKFIHNTLQQSSTLSFAKVNPLAPLSSHFNFQSLPKPFTPHLGGRRYFSVNPNATSRPYTQRPVLSLSSPMSTVTPQGGMRGVGQEVHLPPTDLSTPTESTSAKALRYSYIWLLGCGVFLAWQLTNDVMESQQKTAQLEKELSETHALLLDLQKQSVINQQGTISNQGLHFGQQIQPLPTISQQVNYKNLNQIDAQNGSAGLTSYGTVQMGNIFSSGKLHEHLEQIPAIHHLTHLPHYHFQHVTHQNGQNTQNHSLSSPNGGLITISQQQHSPGILIYQQPSLTSYPQQQQQQQQQQSQSQHQILVPVNKSSQY